MDRFDEVPRCEQRRMIKYCDRKVKDQNTVGRVRHIIPSVDRKELFYFRLILNTKPGPTSFVDLRTITLEDGSIEECKTYRDAAFRMGLLRDDKEYLIPILSFEISFICSTKFNSACESM